MPVSESGGGCRFTFDGLAIGEGYERCLLAFQKFFHQHLAPGVAEFPFQHYGINSVKSFLQLAADDHAFPSSQPVGFYNYRRSDFADI